MIIAKIVATAVAATALTLGAVAPAQAAPSAMTPAAVDSFQLTAGQPQWAGPTEARLARTVFTATPDGRFVIHQPDGYPTLVGTYTQDGGFQASAAMSSGVGTTEVEAAGQMVDSGGGVQMTLDYVSGGSLSAVVNGTAFGSTSTKAFHATMTMRAA